MANLKKKNQTPAQRLAAETFEKKTGLAHLFAAGQYSAQGFKRLIKEAAFRHEILAFVAGLLMFCVEALNTAIEELVDRISPEISTVGRNAKDLGSFAVFCLITANAVFTGYVVVSRLLG
jgi:diacylglycerol kinase (ATP)